MRLPASRRQGRTVLFPAACVAVLGSALALAQQPDAPAAAPAAAAPAKKAAAPAARTPSYSLGVMFGQQLRASSLTNESINATQLAAGIKDALGRQGRAQRRRQGEHHQAGERGRRCQPCGGGEVPGRQRQEARRRHHGERPAVQGPHPRQRRAPERHRRGDRELQGDAAQWHRVRQQLQARRAGEVPAQPRDPGLVRGRRTHEAGREIPVLDPAAARLRPEIPTGHPAGFAAGVRSGADQRQGPPACPSGRRGAEGAGAGTRPTK